MTKSKTLRVQMVAAVTAMLLVSFMVVRTSSAAFTGSAESATNSVGTSTVYFADAGELAFDTGDGLIPGDSIVQCVEVTYSGTEFDQLGGVTLNVPAWTADDGTDDIDDALDVTSDGTTLLTDGTDGSAIANLTVAVGNDDTVTCSTLAGELEALTGDLLGDTTLTSGTDIYDSTLVGFEDSNTVTGWTPASDDTSRAFAFRISIPSDADNQLQGDSVSGTFTWNVEASNS